MSTISPQSSPELSPQLLLADSIELVDNIDEIMLLRRKQHADDIFDPVLGLEERYIEQGYLEGKHASFRAATIQGKNLGFEYGQDLGEEIGFYLGFFQSFLFNLLQQYYSSSDEQLPQYTLDYGNQTLHIDEIKAYNKTYFAEFLLDTPICRSQLKQQLSFTDLKYTNIITEFINLLSTTQSIRFMPGETGDLHLVIDVRTRTKALFARLGVSGIFKDQTIIDF